MGTVPGFVRLLALAALLVLAACGDDAPAETSAEQAAETPAATETPTEGEEPPPEPTEADAAPPDGDGEGIEALLEDAADLGAPTRVTYDVELRAGPTMTGTSVIAHDEDRWSVHSEMDGFVSLMIVDEDEHATCAQMEGAWMCFAGEQPDLAPGPGDELLTDDPGEEFGAWRSTGTETIAGREAACGLHEDVEVCFDRDTGQVLRIDSAEMAMAAVEVGTPTADDFALPAEPMEVGDGFPGDLSDLDLEDLPGMP